MIGNFIADHIKGKMIHEFPAAVQEGIFLHRQIDEFTDSHPVVAESKARLRTDFKKYAPVIVDVFYDHFLARDWQQFHHQSLMDFSNEVYNLLDNYPLLPERTRVMLSYMSQQNWLYNYRDTAGINKALGGLARRTNFESGMERATAYLEEHYQDFEKEFNTFFAELRTFVAAATS